MIASKTIEKMIAAVGDDNDMKNALADMILAIKHRGGIDCITIYNYSHNPIHIIITDDLTKRIIFIIVAYQDRTIYYKRDEWLKAIEKAPYLSYIQETIKSVLS